MAKKISNPRPVAAIVLAAGLGTRMKSNLQKVLHPIAGRPMIQHLLASVEKLNPDRVIVVANTDSDDVQAAVRPYSVTIQSEQLGTGHAVLQTADHLADFDGDILILFGGDPLVTPETIENLLKRHRQEDNPGVTVLGFRPADPGLYGRLIFDEQNQLIKIVEARDATPEQLASGLCNSGLMVVDRNRFFEFLSQIGNDNAKQEYYLTDIIEIYQKHGIRCAAIEARNPDELIGVDTRADLARVEAIMQNRLRNYAMEHGATLVAPDTVFFSFDTVVGLDVVIGPNVIFAPGVTIGNNVVIHSFCHLTETSVADGATIGPFARLRPGTKVGENVNIGNFVEIKNAILEKSVKINHLSYVGDAKVGANTNVGAGTITCNYDGFSKHYTDIGSGTFIGSNTALVAPVSIGDGAVIGAGSVISKDVDSNALGITRAPQKQLKGWATSFRANKPVKRNDKKSK